MCQLYFIIIIINYNDNNRNNSNIIIVYEYNEYKTIKQNNQWWKYHRLDSAVL